MDYPEDAASDVLDFLFKPDYGLNLQMLKVELGGDTDATEGAEPSHMHFKGDENYQRGYEWWLMKEAKKRKPDIKLYGLPWGWPGWLDPSASPDQKAQDAFADPEVTANYTMAWLLGAKREHGLTIDYVGQWNERDAPAPYNEALKKAIENSELAGVTTPLVRLPHYPGTTDKPDDQGCTQYDWNTTDGSRWVDEEGSIYDGRSARCLARCVNRQYVSGCKTAIFQWHLVSSFYDYLPWSRCGVAVANEPWSGAFEITAPTWALAHTSQFAPVGWRYAAHGSGVQMLNGGGSMVTRISPDGKDFSMVIEKMNSANSACARGSNPTSASSEEELEIAFAGSFLKAVQGRALQVWYSNLTSGSEESVNPPTEQLFLRKEALKVGADGTVKLKVLPDEIYTLTTLTTGGKGIKASPPSSKFPVPFKQSFDDEKVSAPPKIWYDQMGAWEIQDTPYGDDHGRVMRQVVPVWPACWGYSCAGPTTYFGPQGLGFNIEVSMDVRLEDHAAFTLEPQGLSFQKLTLDTKGIWQLGSESGELDFATDAWHKLTLTMGDGWQAASVDGKRLVNISEVGRRSPMDACDESAFPVDLTGKQYMGLKAGPSSAGTADACQQACCDMGDACHVWQFSDTPSRNPKCWLGNSNSYTKDPDHNYVSRGRDLAGWNLKVSLDRYIFASIDNFELAPAGTAERLTHAALV
jgi:galactosylceramidase